MIILTGGAGFIGSCMLWKLNEAGITDVLVVDSMSEEKKKNLESKKYLDFVDKESFLSAVEKGLTPGPVSAVIHLGACTSTTLSDEEYMMHNNYHYSMALARWSLDRDIHFIYASSAATYGDGSQGFCDDDDHTRRMKPLNVYGLSKQLFDLWVLDSNLAGKVTGLKFFNVYGPNEYHKGSMMSVICKKFEDVRSKGRTGLFKSYHPDYQDGCQMRDFIYVKDAIDIVYYFFTHPGVAGIYNVGTGKARTWRDVISAMFSYFNREPVIDYIEMPEILKDKYQYFTEADTAKLRRSGYTRQFTPLEDAVRDYCGYLDGHRYL